MGKLKDALWAELLAAAADMDAQEWEFGGQTCSFVVVEKEKYDRLYVATVTLLPHVDDSAKATD